MSHNLLEVQRKQLQHGVAQLALEINDDCQRQLLEYLALLHKWNHAYNLTAVRDPAEHVSRHLLDALSILPHLQGERFLDVGTGPGIPGMILAIAMPGTQWTLLDSNGKKTRFLTQCKMTLGLDNVDVVHSRIEQYRPGSVQFDGITSRAFATLADMVNGCQHLFGDATLAYAMKGINPVDEIEQLPETFRVINNIRLSVPDCEAERHLLVLKQASA